MIKLGDFGLATQLEQSRSNSATCGTALYMAPEVFEGKPCLKSDVWALGISIIEMAEGKHPFEGYTTDRVRSAVLNGNPPSLTSSQWSSDLVNFVRKCLVKDVNKRASVDELLKVRFDSKSDE